MRKLTIKRTKSFVGSLGIMKVYIEDKDGDTVICEVSCRKLGDLKNGEEASFDISNERAKIYVIADKLSSDYCNDCYQLEAGDENISLTGKNKFNPARGNAFLFDENDAPETRINREKGLKKGTLVVICSILVGLLIGYGITTATFGIIKSQPETYTAEEMTITLNKGFNRQYAFGYTGIFVSDRVEVFIFKNEFDKMETKNLTETEYARAVMANQKVSDYEVVENDGLTSFVFSKETTNGQSYKYHLYAFKTDDAYWHIFFAVEEDWAKFYDDEVSRWARSIVIE